MLNEILSDGETNTVMPPHMIPGAWILNKAEMIITHCFEIWHLNPRAFNKSSIKKVYGNTLFGYDGHTAVHRQRKRALSLAELPKTAFYLHLKRHSYSIAQNVQM